MHCAGRAPALGLGLVTGPEMIIGAHALVLVARSVEATEAPLSIPHRNPKAYRCRLIDGIVSNSAR
jgi:hypothetical protein